MVKKNIFLLAFMFLFISCSDSDPVIYVPPILGCMDQSACNYDSDAEASCPLEDEECEACEYEVCVGCTHGPGFDSDGNADEDNPGACNYDPDATEDIDGGSCVYDSCAGCTDSSACNYNLDATIDDGTCYSNYDTLAQAIDLGGAPDNESGVCLLPSGTLYVTSSGSVFYNSSEDIYGFQFDVSGATILGASGGDSAAAGFTVGTGGSLIIGYSLTGAFIPAGCGTLTELSISGTITGVDDIILSATAGSNIDFSYLSGCDCTLSTPLDCVGVCGGETLFDDCGVCAGDGSTCTDCAGTTNGGAITCGISGSGVGDDYCISQETCDDRIAVQAIIDANASLSGENIDDLTSWNEDGRAIRLDLSNKGISTIPSDIEGLTELTQLYLAYNDFIFISSSITSLAKLEHLNIAFNNITSLPSTIGNLSNLVNLDVEGNSIASLPDNILLLSNLQTLKVVGNELTQLPSLAGLNNLKTIYASHNSLSSLTVTILSLSSLNYLDVSSNQITSLPDGICNMSLSSLLISGNQICDDLEAGCSSINVTGEDNQSCD